MNLPERDRYSFRKTEIEARLATMFGGRVAEEIIFGAENVTTGASNDFQQATQLARRMVTEWGMSEKLGPLRYSENEDEVFLGRSVTRTQHVSEETARLIDLEVRRIIEEAEAQARRILTEHLDSLHRLAQALLEYETLSGEEVRTLLEGGDIRRSSPSDADSREHEREDDREVRQRGRSHVPAAGRRGPRLQPEG
jgi:cell division protease FtsH